MCSPWNWFFMWSPFQSPFMVCISVIIHFTHSSYKFSMNLCVLLPCTALCTCSLTCGCSSLSYFFDLWVYSLATRPYESSSIYQLYYLTTTRIRTQPCTTHLVDECWVRTRICQSLILTNLVLQLDFPSSAFGAVVFKSKRAHNSWRGQLRPQRQQLLPLPLRQQQQQHQQQETNFMWVWMLI